MIKQRLTGRLDDTVIRGRKADWAVRAGAGSGGEHRVIAVASREQTNGEDVTMRRLIYNNYYYGWNIVAMTALSQFTSFGIAINCISLYLPYWKNDLHAPLSTLALCYTFAGSVFALLSPITGQATERLPVKWMMAAGLLGTGVLFTLASRVTAAWQLVALFATVAPVSMVVAGHVPAQVLVTRWFDRRRGLALGLCLLGQSAAGAVLPPILAGLLPTIGWRHLFVEIAAAVALICAPLAALIIRNHPKSEEGVGFERTAEAGKARRTIPPLLTKDILRNRNFWALLSTSALCGYISSGFLVNLAPFAMSHGYSSVTAATLLSILSVTILAAKLISGIAVDRVRGKVVLATTVGLTALGIAAVQISTSYQALVLSTILVATGSSLIVPVGALIAREFGPAGMGRAVGTLGLITVLVSTAPPVVAFMREASGGYRVPFALLSILGLAGTLNALIFYRERPRSVIAGDVSAGASNKLMPSTSASID